MSFGAPTTAEIDALERVLAEADGHMPDGYWRALAEDGLEAAKTAAMRAAVQAIDAEIAGCESLLTVLRSAPMNRIDPGRNYVKVDGLFHELGEGRN